MNYKVLADPLKKSFLSRKKKSLLLTTLATIGLTAITLAQNVPNYVPANGLVGWWPFNGNALDESFNGNNGTVNGAITAIDRFGTSNAAFSFDGVDDLISVGSVNNISTFSISCWYKRVNDLSVCYPIGLGINALNTVDFFKGYGLGIAPNSTFTCGLFANQIFANDGLYTCGNLVGNTVSLTNTWEHVVLLSDGSSATLYVNGILSQSSTSIYIPGILNFVVGSRSDDFGFFSGSVDDIGIWNRALTECEIQDLYNAQLNSANGISAGADQTICSGDNVTLQGSGGTAYVWSNNVTNEQAFTPTSTSDYILLGTAANGCSGTDTVSVIVLEHSSSTQTQTAMDSYTWPVNGQTYTQSGTYNEVIPNAVGCDSTITLDLILSFTEIDEHVSPILVTFPNPVNNYVIIYAPDQYLGKSYTIIDQSGKVIIEGTLNKKEQKIDLGNLTDGMYMLKMNNETKQTLRILKN